MQKRKIATKRENEWMRKTHCPSEVVKPQEFTIIKSCGYFLMFKCYKYYLNSKKAFPHRASPHVFPIINWGKVTWNVTPFFLPPKPKKKASKRLLLLFFFFFFSFYVTCRLMTQSKNWMNTEIKYYYCQQQNT